MRYRRLSLWLLAVFVATAWIFGPWHSGLILSAHAAEPAEAFLQGLEDHGLNDMAMEYLERIESSPLCPPEFKPVIDYKAGIILVAEAGTVRSISERAKRLDAARQRFERFLAEHAGHKLASNATTQLANVLVERGRMLSDESRRPSKTDAEKKRLVSEARGLYGEAEAVFLEAEKRYVDLLKSMPAGPIDKKDIELIDARNRARADLMQSRLFIGTVIYERAMTYPPKSTQRDALLNEAAKKYNALYEKYGSWLAGLYARMWEGRCYKELGDYKKALLIFEELLAQNDEPIAFRQLKNKALVLFLKTSLLSGAEQYKPAADSFNEWEKSSRPNEQSSNDGLAIKYLAGEALLEYARQMQDADSKRQDSIAKARELFQFVSRFPGDYQRSAKIKLADPLLGGNSSDQGSQPATFAEAQERGKAALDQLQVLETQKRLQGNSKSSTATVKEIADLQAKAIRYYQMALRMVSSETPLEDVNTARYYLAYLHWLAGDTYRAAVLGEFLAVRYPNTTVARQGAKIAMAAYAKLYNQATAGSAAHEFGNRHMVAMAGYITKLWPESPEAADAWMMLLHTAVASGNLSRAAEFLKKIPPDSSQRGEAELMLGRAYWAAYLRAQRFDDDERPKEAELQKQLDEAKRLLAAGIEHTAEKIDASLFASVLSLAQINLRDGHQSEAVKLLDHPKYGPHTLLKEKHPASNQPGYDVETYKTALRAYVANRDLEKAEKTMDRLEKAVAAEGGAEAASKLTKIYISLGRELQEQLADLRKQNKAGQLKDVSEAFELFLDRILQREEGNTFNSLNWVAETFYGMGLGFDPGGEVLPPEAEKYYRKAADAYRAILVKCKQDENYAPRKDAVYGIRMRMAKCLLSLGQYENAMKYLLSVLVRRNMMIDAQVLASEVYQAWAAVPGNAKRYQKAIMGGYRSKKTNSNVVWGWQKIAKLTAVSKTHADIFHKARYNMAVCQMQLALELGGQDKKDALEAAEKSIVRLQILYPEMGGPRWWKKYDNLLKKIEKLQEKRPVGLKRNGS